MSKDLTDALRALMEQPEANVVPALVPRGAAPRSIASAAPAASPKSGGGGIASPLTEASYAARTHWTDKTILTSDGVWALKIKPIKSITFTDPDSNPVVLNFADRP